MELSRHRQTASLNFGALLSKGSSMPLTRDAANATDGAISSTDPADRSSARTAVAPNAWGLGPFHVNNAANPKPGVKLDAGKAPVAQGFVAYFSRAMEAIAKVSQYGKEKYKVAFAEQNWRKVENGQNRYADALQRHWSAHLRGEVLDPESGKPHLDHVGWNVVALIELRDSMPETLVDGK